VESYGKDGAKKIKSMFSKYTMAALHGDVVEMKNVIPFC
jgi:hypothetical protein